jgi:hypothetical protein
MSFTEVIIGLLSSYWIGLDLGNLGHLYPRNLSTELDLDLDSSRP